MVERSEFLTCQKVLNIIVLLGFMIHHMLRVNISIAIVEMVAKNITNTSLTNTTSENFGPRYNWNEEEKNDVLGCFFWGYLMTQIPGGYLSEKFGAKIVVGTGLLTSSFMTLLTPIVANFSYRWLVFVRFCLGIALGIHWPSTHPIAIKWIPPNNMASFISHITASSLGVAITLPACGYLIVYFGWPTVFYVTGSIALVWSLSWFYLMYNTPEEHPRISTAEKEKLRSEITCIESSSKKIPTPWLKIMTSGPVWAVIVCNTCASCTFFVAFNQLPTYMSQVLHFNIKTNGWLSSLPYLVRYFVAVLSGTAADRLKKSEKFSTTTIRKFFTVLLFFGTSCLFTVQAFWGYSRIVSVVVFTGCLALMGLSTPGFHTNPMDIAPAHSGTIFGISQVPGAISGYLTTKIVALLTKDNQGFEQWVFVFWMLVFVNLFATIFNAIFMSGEEQNWSKTVVEPEAERLHVAEQ